MSATSDPTDIAVDLIDREIVVSRIINAPREKVFAAWTDPEQIVKWWGPDGFTTTIEQMDLRPGGVRKLVMHGPDGTDYHNKSVYVEIVEPERLVYEQTGGRQGGGSAQFNLTATFEDREGRTELTMRMTFRSAAARDQVIEEFGALEGAKQTIARLAQLMEGN
ncbi:MAG: SRPBCC family protein [Pyrinomonadaceae bacterium]